jgi:hypothetical protein
MSEQDWIELGKRAVACDGFRWMPGMLDTDGARVTRVSTPYLYLVEDDGADECALFQIRFMDMPDLRDPATIGCLLQLVREAWPGKGGRPNKYLRPLYAAIETADGHRQGWFVAGIDRRDRVGVLVPHPTATEAQALVAALEAGR